MAANIIAASRTVRVIGPSTETPGKALAGHIGTRPSVGFRPTRPLQAAGMRIEPPASVPICNGPKPAVVCAGFQALRVMPFSGQSPGDFQPYSVVVVLPTMTAPAAFRPTTAGASSATGLGSEVRLPRLVG